MMLGLLFVNPGPFSLPETLDAEGPRAALPEPAGALLHGA